MPTIRVRAGILAVLALVALPACGRGQQDFAQIPTGPTPLGHLESSCTRDISFLEPDPGESPAGVPFPTPAGARVKPGITGIPLPPGSVEVDGFETNRAPGPGGGTRAVQVFDVALSETEVLAFFDDSFRGSGWILTGISQGPGGTDCTFVPTSAFDPGSGPGVQDWRNWVAVSTASIPRKEDENVQPPPGFRGKAVPFAPANPGLTRFWLVTPK